MRLKVITFCLTLSVFSLSASLAANPPKSGNTCAKAGISKNYQGKKFTCVKNGKKLVWSKGIQISANPKPSESVSPRQKTDPWVAASQEISEKLKASIPISANFDFLITSDANQLFSGHAKETLLTSAQFWGNTYSPSKTIPIAIGAPKSLESITRHLSNYSYSIPQWRLDQLKNLNEDGMQLDVDANPATDSVMYLVAGNQLSWLNVNMAKTMITHEYVHTVQAGLLKTRNGLIPCWSNEGSAIFYGNSIVAASNASNDYFTLRNNWLAQLNFKNAIAGKSNDELLDLLKRSEEDFKVCAAPLRLGYSAGSLMTELLVAEHGHEKFVKWWVQSKDKNWKIAFKEVFGLEINDFYSNIAIPFLLRSPS
jgi:hypothetical protein